MSKTLLAGTSLRARDASRGIRVGRSMGAAVMMALAGVGAQVGGLGETSGYTTESSAPNQAGGTQG